MTIKPKDFDTFVVTLDGDPIDLNANSVILPWPPNIPPYSDMHPVGPIDEDDYSTREVFIQCIAGSANWREARAQPATDSDGHLLQLGDGVIVTLTRRARAAHGFWVWGATAGTRIAISPAAGAPVRETRYDIPVPPAAD